MYYVLYQHKDDDNECISKMLIVNMFDLVSVYTSVSIDCSVIIRFCRYVQTLAAQHNINVVCMTIDLRLKIYKKIQLSCIFECCSLAA